jgi:hypothetical protein
MSQGEGTWACLRNLLHRFVTMYLCIMVNYNCLSDLYVIENKNFFSRFYLWGTVEHNRAA